MEYNITMKYLRLKTATCNLNTAKVLFAHFVVGYLGTIKHSTKHQIDECTTTQTESVRALLNFTPDNRGLGGFPLDLQLYLRCMFKHSQKDSALLDSAKLLLNYCSTLENSRLFYRHYSNKILSNHPLGHHIFRIKVQLMTH